MKRRIQIVIRTAVALSIVAAAAITWATRRENHYLKRVIHENQKQLILSADDCRLLTSELSSVDLPSLAYWKLMFQRGADGKVEQGQATISFQERIDTYYSRYEGVESPRRSNYFAALLLSLIQKQHDEGLQTKDLLRYLGPPDSTSNTVHGVVHAFGFSANGKQAIGTFESRNGVVSRCSVLGAD